MSETIESAAPEAPQEAAVTEAPEVVDQVAEPEAAPQPEKPKQGDRRFAIMTAKLKAEEAARQSAERERDAALALANAGKDLDPPAPTRNVPHDIEVAAARLVQQREFETRRDVVVTEGSKEYPDWQERTAILHGLGATSNAAFMEALVELPNAAKLVAHLADDADALVTLLGKSPTAMAAAMGRMDAELSKPVTRTLSNAPKPVTAITTPAVVKEPDAYDEKLSMRDYVALRNKQAPRHLGGRG